MENLTRNQENKIKNNENNNENKLSPIEINDIIVKTIEECDLLFLLTEKNRIENENKIRPNEIFEYCSRPGSCVLITLFMYNYVFVANLGYNNYII